MPLYKIKAETVINTKTKDEAIQQGQEKIGTGRWSSLDVVELKEEQM